MGQVLNHEPRELRSDFSVQDLTRYLPPDRPLTGYRFRAVRPTFHSHPFRLEVACDGDAMTLWTIDHEGPATMQAEATLAACPGWLT